MDDKHAELMRRALLSLLNDSANVVKGGWAMPLPWPHNDEWVTETLAEILFPEKYVLTEADYVRAILTGLIIGTISGAIMALVIAWFVLSVVPGWRG